MKKTKFFAAVLVVSAMLFAFSACSTTNPFLGTWQYEESGMTNTITINSDKSCVQTSSVGEQEIDSAEGIWAINKERTFLTVTFAAEQEGEEDSTLLFQLQDDELVLLAQTYHYKKQ